MKLPPFAYKLTHPKSIPIKLKKLIEPNFSLKDKKVLDFGCGTGTNARIFEPKDYTGVDIDLDRIELAQELNPKYNFEQIKDEKIDLPDESQDYIFICGVLHHISDEVINKYIKEFKRILKHKGSLLIFEPADFPEWKISSKLMILLDDGEYIRKEKEYFDLFKDFKVKEHNKFRIIYFYRTLFFSATKD